jgi:hypothetical protein
LEDIVATKITRRALSFLVGLTGGMISLLWVGGVIG